MYNLVDKVRFTSQLYKCTNKLNTEKKTTEITNQQIRQPKANQNKNDNETEDPDY